MVLSSHECTSLLSKRRLVCQIGDSGGPLLIPHAPNGDISAGRPEKDLIIGITSFGSESCVRTEPGVYASVGFYWNGIWDAIYKVPNDVSRHLTVRYDMLLQNENRRDRLAKERERMKQFTDQQLLSVNL